MPTSNQVTDPTAMSALNVVVSAMVRLFYLDNKKKGIDRHGLIVVPGQVAAGLTFDEGIEFEKLNKWYQEFGFENSAGVMRYAQDAAENIELAAKIYRTIK